MGIDDYYSPEDDTEEAGEGEGQVREGTCLLDSFPLSTRAGEGRARPAGPLPGQQGEEQGAYAPVSLPGMATLPREEVHRILFFETARGRGGAVPIQ